GLVFTICRSITAKEVLLEERNTPQGRSWSTLWDATGQQRLDKFSTLATSGRDGFGSATTQPSINSGDELSLLIVGTGDTSISAGFGPFTDAGVPSHQWLQSNGSLTDDPCPF
ncbi:hypothetical protein, partial [Subtercola frigoramans]